MMRWGLGGVVVGFGRIGGGCGTGSSWNGLNTCWFIEKESEVNKNK